MKLRSALWRAAKRPVAPAVKLGGLARLGVAVPPIVALIVAVWTDSWVWVPIIGLAGLAVWWLAAATLAERELGNLTATKPLDLRVVPCAVEHPGGPVRSVAGADRLNSFLFVVHNHSGRVVSARASFVNQSVRGIEAEYPQGDMALRWQVPEGRDHRFTFGSTWRVDVAFANESLRTLSFLGPDERDWGWFQLRPVDGFVTGLIDLEDIDTGEVQRVRFEIRPTGAEHPPSIAVERVNRETAV